MTALLPILGALKNPWLLLVIACAAGITGTSLYRAKYHAVLAQNAIAIAEAQQKADALANELIVAQAAALATTEKVVTVYKEKVIRAPSTSTCGPVLRDAARGLCAAFAGQPDAKCGVAPPVH